MCIHTSSWLCYCPCLLWGMTSVAAPPTTEHLGSWDDYYVGRVLPNLVASHWSGEQYASKSILIDLTRIRDTPVRVRNVVARFNRGELNDYILRLPSPFSVPFVIIDINNDGHLDFLTGQGEQRGTFVWDTDKNDWRQLSLPTALGAIGGRLACLTSDGVPTLLIRSVAQIGAWRFVDGTWQAASQFVRGLSLGDRRLLTSAGGADRGVRFYDLDGDGRDELIIANPDQQGVLQWAEQDNRWQAINIRWPKDAIFVTHGGEDAGCRLADINGDKRLDILMSTPEWSAAYLWQSDQNRFSEPIAKTPRDAASTAFPMFANAGRSTNAWFHEPTRSVMAAGPVAAPNASQPWDRALRFGIAFTDVLPGFSQLLNNDGGRDIWWDYLGNKSPNHFIRQQQKGTRIAWQTATVSQGDLAQAVRFVFVGAMGYRSEPATAGFQLTCDESAPIHFDLAHKHSSWSNVDKTLKLVFEPTWRNDVDAAGYFFLTVDRSLLKSGKPLAVSVVSVGEGSKRWFAIHPVTHPRLVDETKKK